MMRGGIERRFLAAHTLAAAVIALGLAAPDSPAGEPLAASQAAVPLDKQIDWTRGSLIVVQDEGRYKTLDSFAREHMSEMYGSEHFPGLTPLGSLMEWLFNRGAYFDTPVIRIKDRGLRLHFAAHLNEATRKRVIETGRMTPREFASPKVQRLIAELEPKNTMVKAIGRVRNSQEVLEHTREMLRIIPPPVSDRDALWYPPDPLKSNLAVAFEGQTGIDARTVIAEYGNPIPDITVDAAWQVIKPWKALEEAWRAGNAAGVQAAVDTLADVLPTLAPPGVYPSEAHRAAEVRYYALGKFVWGWIAYFIGALAAVWAMLTGWRWASVVAQILLLIGMTIHAYGIGLRWQILERIPVANMFEALTASAWIAISVVLGIALSDRYRTGPGWLRRSLGVLYAACALACSFVAIRAIWFRGAGPGSSLDAWLLVVATFLILALYAYLLVSSLRFIPQLFFQARVRPVFLLAASATGFFALLMAGYVLPGGGTITTIMGILDDVMLRIHTVLIISSYALIFLASVIALVYLAEYYFGAAKASATALPSVGPVGAGFVSGGVLEQRPLLAGDAPGDERVREVPAWLNQIDWCHLIILNMVFVMLFVGTILGAVWADYSWGRPWGWDPKEVFALNTWIIYAILIHARFVVANKGLSTAWLSVAGCLMMAFNWCFVNFFIVGLHSYA